MILIFYHTLVVPDLSDNKEIENRWDNDNYNHPPYLNYYPGEPVVAGNDVVCVAMDTEHGLWVTEECILPKGFVCKVNNKLLRKCLLFYVYTIKLFYGV